MRMPGVAVRGDAFAYHHWNDDMQWYTVQWVDVVVVCDVMPIFEHSERCRRAAVSLLDQQQRLKVAFTKATVY